jgi:Molecular chaperone (small heat shock protein)
MPRIFNDYFNDTLFDDVFNTPSTNGNMNVDIQEFENHYLLDFELPGFKKENIKAELRDGYLTVSATRNDDNEQSEGNYIRRERFMGQVARSFYVGEQITQEDIKARFDNGILTIEVPKKEKVEKVEDKHYISIEG